MKVKIHAGAEIDTLNAEELRGELRGWMQEIARGARMLRRSLSGAVDAGGNLNIPADGPADGFVWAITRLSVAGLTGAQSVSVYANDANPSSLLWAGLTGNAAPGDHGIVLGSGESLVIAGTGLTASASIVVTATIKEVPSVMVWSL